MKIQIQDIIFINNLNNEIRDKFKYILANIYAKWGKYTHLETVGYSMLQAVKLLKGNP